MNFNNSLAQLPAPSAKRIALHVTAPAERALRQGHPWVFDQSITEQSHEGAPGDLAVIFDNKRRFLAIGLYDPTSTIRVRVLQSRQPATINAEWFQKKLTAAAQIREPLESTDTTGYRLVHGENDGFPGLVIDRYADTLVLKLYTPAWIPHLKEFCDALAQVSPAEHLILRLNRILQKQTEFLHNLSDGMTLSLQTPPSLILFKENGLTFESDPILGQKTGFFLDQRDNRAKVPRRQKSPAVVSSAASVKCSAAAPAHVAASAKASSKPPPKAPRAAWPVRSGGKLANKFCAGCWVRFWAGVADAAEHKLVAPD